MSREQTEGRHGAWRRPGQVPPEITAEGLARAIGAVVTTGLLLGVTPLGAAAPFGYQFILLGLVVCPAIATVFSLPRLSLGLYVANGLFPAALIAFVSGADAAVRDEEIGTRAFFWAFPFSAFLSLAGLVMWRLALDRIKPNSE